MLNDRKLCNKKCVLKWTCFILLQIESILSSVRDTLGLVYEQFEDIAQTKSKSDKKSNRNKSVNFSNDDISQLLGIVNEYTEQVEGSFSFNFAGGQKFLPFDNHTLQNIPSRK